MALGPQTRCAGCGRFIVSRADHDDFQAEERAYHADQVEEHVCSLDWQPEAAWSPRAGEHDAYLAMVELEHGSQVEEDLWNVATVENPSTLIARSAAPAQTNTPDGAAKPNAITVNPTPAWMEGDQQHDRVSAVRMRTPAPQRPATPVRPVRMVRPAEYAGGGQQLDLTGGHRGPARSDGRRVVPSPWPRQSAPDGRRTRPAASIHGPAQPIPLASLGGNSDRATPKHGGGLTDGHTRPASSRTRSAPNTGRAAASGLPRRDRSAQQRCSGSQAGWNASARSVRPGRRHTVDVQPAGQVEYSGIPAAIGRWFRQRDKRPELQQLARTGPFGT